MKHSEALKAAKAVIANPENWTQGTYYRREDGSPTDIRSLACKFCSYGAMRVANEMDSDRYLLGQEYIYRALIVIGKEKFTLDTFNDNHSHKDVMALFDKAIELAEKEGE